MEHFHPCPRPSGGDGRDLQLAVLNLILQEHPHELTFVDLADRLFANPGDPNAGVPLAKAVRDLSKGGLLRCRGPLVLPTRAALHVKILELRQ